MWRGVGVKGCMCEGGLYTKNSEMYGRVKLWRVWCVKWEGVGCVEGRAYLLGGGLWMLSPS